MKRFIIISAVLAYAGAAHADIIALRSGENIENAKVTAIAYDEVTYNLNSQQTTIASSDVQGVLYDDGRFVVPPSQPAMHVAESVQADDSQGKDNATVGNASNSGKSATKGEKSANKAEKSLNLTERKQHSESEVERKPEKRATERTPAAPTSAKEKKIIPSACYNEANEAFKRIYNIEFNKALNQGYNKFQAASIASDAAQQEKLRVLDECYERRVVQYDNNN